RWIRPGDLNFASTQPCDWRHGLFRPPCDASALKRSFTSTRQITNCRQGNQADFTYQLHYSLALLLRPVVSSFLTSSADSFGRSIVSVSLSIFPVNLNGTW